jgi:hypothetical protein
VLRERESVTQGGEGKCKHYAGERGQGRGREGDGKGTGMGREGDGDGALQDLGGRGWRGPVEHLYEPVAPAGHPPSELRAGP